MKNKLLVWEPGCGLSLEHINRLIKDGNEVHLFNHWQSAFPKFTDYAVGLGFEGIKKELYFQDVKNEADAIIFFDIGAGDLCHSLRSQINPATGKNYVCYGAGMGERLEYHRRLFRQIQKELGLPTQETAPPIYGIDNLRQYIEAGKKKGESYIVKIDKWRGDRDTFAGEYLDDVLPEMIAAWGPFIDQIDFIVEKKLEKIVELGADIFFNGKMPVKSFLLGLEYEKGPYIGKFVESLPAPMQRSLQALTPVLRELDYRGALSIEEIFTDKDTSYIIDMCCRMPFPLSVVYPEAIANYSELIWKVAKAEYVRIDPTGKYVGILPLESPHARTNWVELKVEEKDRDTVKFRTAAKAKDGKYYAVKGLSSVMVLTAVGKSVDEVVEKLESGISKVDCFDLDTDALGGLKHAYENVKKMQKVGIEF
jgi:hypothetical protein